MRPGSVFSIVFLLLLPTEADEHDHIYEDMDEVVLWMNTVGPYHNRQETYPYFSLPFCAGPKKAISHYHETLGEALLGVELEYSGLWMQFKKDIEKNVYCSMQLTEEKVDALKHAIKNYYWYQMYIDDLPIWGLVGEYVKTNDGEVFKLFTHKKFEIGFNGKRIIDVNLTTDDKRELVVGEAIDYTYEVKWTMTDVSFDDRFNKYLDVSFFQHKIHWFSIINSSIMTLFLVGLVLVILMRTLKKDYARYSKESEVDDIEGDLGDEYGWKQIHGDVFRPPSHLMLFCSLVGTGYHVFMVLIVVICSTIIGELYTQRGSLLSAIIFSYSAIAPVNGYVGGSMYAKFGGKLWIRQMLLGTFLLPAMICSTAFLVNFIAIYYNATRAIPFTSMLAITAICFFVILPLSLVGTVLGRNLGGQANYPCRINAVPRPIPEKKLYMEPLVIVLLGGILPFGSIFIEVYFIFTSFWAYKIYYVYGFMLLVVLLLVLVTMCITVVCTYLLLNSEDYRWRWTSFLTGTATAVYVYLYSFYYFFFKTKMFGLFQTAFYFGYMAVFSVTLGIMCGTFGYFAASKFVEKIYSAVKID